MQDAPTAQIFPFPECGRVAPPPAPAASPIASPRWIDLHGIARLLPLTGETATLLRYIAALISGHGFPVPASVRIRNGRLLAGAETLTARSLWHFSQVEAWLAARNQPGVAATVHPHRAARVDDALAQRFASKGIAA